MPKKIYFTPENLDTKVKVKFWVTSHSMEVTYRFLLFQQLCNGMLYSTKTGIELKLFDLKPSVWNMLKATVLMVYPMKFSSNTLEATELANFHIKTSTKQEEVDLQRLNQLLPGAIRRFEIGSNQNLLVCLSTELVRKEAAEVAKYYNKVSEPKLAHKPRPNKVSLFGGFVGEL